MPIYIAHARNIIESVDSIIRDGTDTPYMCNMNILEL